jgi:hypothetical protein
MHATLASFANRLSAVIRSGGDSLPFNDAALELFDLQTRANPAYRKICLASGWTGGPLGSWKEIPAAPAAAFKEFELTCLPAAERLCVFHSSGTTSTRPSRHYHSEESLALYDLSARAWFNRSMLGAGPAPSGEASRRWRFISLTPSAERAPHSSLARMIANVARTLGDGREVFAGRVSEDGSWEVDFGAARKAVAAAAIEGCPVALLGTAFNFVHLLERLDRDEARLRLPPGSRIMETGGYKGRSRSVPRATLRAWMGCRLGVTPDQIVSEYGMSELSSQAYDNPGPDQARGFQFPPWARVMLISPETGAEAAPGAPGLVRVFDLANVWSVMAVQTGDLAKAHGDGFELLGRAESAEPRGCSLQSVDGVPGSL